MITVDVQLSTDAGDKYIQAELGDSDPIAQILERFYAHKKATQVTVAFEDDSYNVYSLHADA